jgi:hypothetical protein
MRLQSPKSGSVVPSFAKPAKLGQPLSWRGGQGRSNMGQPPADRPRDLSSDSQSKPTRVRRSVSFRSAISSGVISSIPVTLNVQSSKARGLSFHVLCGRVGACEETCAVPTGLGSISCGLTPNLRPGLLSAAPPGLFFLRFRAQ